MKRTEHHDEQPIAMNSPIFALKLEARFTQMLAAALKQCMEAGPEGGSFLSIQRWRQGYEPTSVALDWEGLEHLSITRGH